MENNLNEQFMKMQHDLRRYFHRQRAKNHGLEAHQGQGRVLALLKLHPEISQKDLIFVLGLRPQSAGELIQKLTDKGWVTREASEEDRRAMIVKLTDLGREEAEKIGQRPDVTADLFADFTDEEKMQWSALVEKLNQKLEEELAGEEDPFEDGPHGPHGHHGKPHGHHGPHHRHHHGHGPHCQRD